MNNKPMFISESNIFLFSNKDGEIFAPVIAIEEITFVIGFDVFTVKFNHHYGRTQNKESLSITRYIDML